MKVIRLTKELRDEDVDKLAGELAGEDSYDILVDEDCDVYKPNGEVLLRFRKNVIPPELCAAAFRPLEVAAKPTDNRGLAGGKPQQQHVHGQVLGTVSGTRAKILKRDGTVSRTTRGKEVKSGIAGYFDRNQRFPYCRMTAYNLNHPEKFRAVMPFVRRVDEVFKELLPDRYDAQMEMVRKTQPDFYISGTSFTTITVNKNFRTAVHKDAGDLKQGFGVMSCLRGGKYEGCFTVFPKFRVAVNMETGDVFCADVHEWHGNTPLKGVPGKFKRISLVFYYRERMAECGTATDELERAKQLRGKLEQTSKEEVQA
jgi:hypothetical protein